VNRERFIKQRRSDWQTYETLLSRLKTSWFSKWSSRDIADLSRLYRSICYDLSLVQSREWGQRLEQYLNDLVAQGHNCLYRSPPQSPDLVWNFLARGFPRLLRKRIGSFLLALGLFLIPFLAGTIAGAMRPDLAELIVGRESLDQVREAYGKSFYEGFDTEYAGQRTSMAGFYVFNNVGIAFKAYSLGCFLGIGTAFILLSNGITIGMITGFVISEPGLSNNFFSFVITHGAFELTAIVISGAGGLVLGQGMLFPGNMSRAASLRHHGEESLQLALGAGVMLGIAALIEGFFSPMPIHPMIKYCVGSFMWILVILYLSLAGREVVTTEEPA
jgi:uncharacterized membrane protein SpoIIM required for sporulation